MDDDPVGYDDESRPDILTRFKAGNHAWHARSSHGRRPIFDSAEQLEAACEEYLDWIADNPMVMAESVKFQGQGGLMAVPKLRAPTLRGMCRFLGINRQTWSNYRDKPDFFDTCESIEDAIYAHKVEAAAAGMMDAGFIGREIGLADKRELSGGVSLTSVGEGLSLEEATRIYEQNLKDVRDDG